MRVRCRRIRKGSELIRPSSVLIKNTSPEESKDGLMRNKLPQGQKN